MQIIGSQFVREEKMYECHECKNEVYPNLQMSFQFKMTQKYTTDEGLMKLSSSQYEKNRNKALKDGIKCFQTTLKAFERGSCSSQRETELLQEVTKFKDESLTVNYFLDVINESWQIMDKLDKCHKKRTQPCPFGPCLENQKVKAIHFALLKVAIEKVRLDNEIMADKFEDSVIELKLLDINNEIGCVTCSRKECNRLRCFDVYGPRSKELKRMGKDGDPCPSLDFLFSCYEKCYTEQEKKRLIPLLWKLMTFYVKEDGGHCIHCGQIDGIPGNKEIAAKMDTCSSILFGSGISENLLNLCNN